MIGNNTIDLQIIKLLTEKMKVIDNIMEGKETTDNDILKEIVRRY